MNDQHRIFEIRITGLQILSHVIAVFGVIRHDKQDGLLVHLFMFGIGLAPFDHTQMQIICILLGIFGALLLLQLCPAGGVRHHRMFNYVLPDRLHQRIIRNGLYEDGPVVVLGRCRYIHL